MARQVLPIVGAVAGFVVGGPAGAQIGFALGSLVGNAVDPIEMQGRKLGDAPTQVAAEGGARAIVYGKGCIRATVVMERGGRRVIRQRDSSGGKGGGPTTINERALWTFAIGLGEPVAAILRIWENEKLVYDVTPGSTIPDDTAAFADRFRFYDGSETQLPDPALEALHGIGNTPYYRGTAYMVFPQYDLTDFGETVPTYRVEVAASVTTVQPSTAMARGTTGGVVASIITQQPGMPWSSLKDSPTDGVAYTAATGNRFILWDLSNAYYSDDAWVSYTPSSGGLGGSGGARNGDARGDIVLIPGGLNDLRRSTDRGASFVTVPGLNRSNYITIGDGLCISAYIAHGYCYISVDDGATWSVGGSHGLTLSGGGAIANDGDLFILGGRISGKAAISITTGGVIWSPSILPGTSGDAVTCIAAGTLNGQRIIVVCTNAAEIYYSDGVSGFTKSSYTPSGSPNSAAFNGEQFYLSSTLAGGHILVSPDGENWTAETHGLSSTAINVEAAYVEAETSTGLPIALSAILSSIHERSGHSSLDYDVSEATDMVAGVVIEQTVTGAEAINSIIGAHFIDPSDYDGEINYIKRGKPVILTLTEDDLIDEPDTSQRNNAIEYPRKVHFLGQRADLAYASSKSTSARYSDDAKVVGEVTIGSPETYDDPTTPAEVAVKLHKVLWTEAEGEREWVIPDNFLKLVPTDNVGLSYRGELFRCRILQVEDTPGQRKLRMIRDRQSAYTANLTEIPNPPSPTPPQSSVVAPTVMAFIDTSALTDNANTLHYLVAMSGANDNWAGAALQQQLAGNFTTIDTTTLNSIMGTLQNTVTDASPYYTDTTNTAVVRLYTDDQLESRSESEFLSNGGAFFLSWQDSGQTHWEIMQFRDAVQDSNGDWVLSRFMRGRKDTETAEHPPGSTFVWIDPSILREPAQTAWIDTVLTHRAVSNGQSPELAVIQNNEYTGNSQREWPVANVLLSMPDADTLEVDVIPRFRFGSSMNPIQSVNWLGLRITSTDGVNTESLDTTSFTHSFDVTGWGRPITVTVWQINRLTGLSEPVIEVIP